jgi:hypothetical protein
MIARRAAIAPRLACAAGLVATLASSPGCYTTTNRATLAPLPTSYPVSLSSEYVEPGGSVVADRDYRIVRPFSFHSSVGALPDTTAITPLPLVADLDRIVAAAQGDAITRMRIQATSYEHLGAAKSGALRLLGWTFGLTGLLFIGIGVGVGGDRVTFGLEVGIPTAATGLALYLLGALSHDPATWEFEVSGNVVKRLGPPSQSEPAATAAVPAVSPAATDR